MALVALEVATADPTLAPRLVAGLRPGAAHAVTSGALLTYAGPASRPDGEGVVTYAFGLEFGTPNVAAAAANWLWSQLQGHAAELRVGGREVRLHHAAIKAALLEAAAEPLPA